MDDFPKVIPPQVKVVEVSRPAPPDDYIIRFESVGKRFIPVRDFEGESVF